MALTNLHNICKDYFESELNPNGTKNLLGIKFANVQLKQYGPATWTSTQPKTDYDGPSGTVEVKRQDSSMDVSGAINTLKNNELVTDVEITNGGVDGIDKKLRLSLPENVKNELGETIEIGIGNKKSDTKKMLHIGVQSAINFPEGATSATAQIKVKDFEYQGNFKCSCIMKGPVIFQLGPDHIIEVEIGEIIDASTGEGSSHMMVGEATFAGFNVERRESTKKARSSKSRVTWNLEGTCNFRWVTKQVVEWKQ